MSERGTAHETARREVVPVPRPLLAAMPALEESHLRALLFALLHEGAPEARGVAAFAAGTGIGAGRVAPVLAELAERGWLTEGPPGEFTGRPAGNDVVGVARIVLEGMDRMEAGYLRVLLYLIGRTRPATAGQVAGGTGIGSRRVIATLKLLMAEGWATEAPPGSWALARGRRAGGEPRAGRKGGAGGMALRR